MLKPNNNRHRLLSNLRGTPPAEAYHIIEALAETEFVDGDICEFGVAQGATSALIANELLNEKRMFHLFDSFKGLPEPTSNDVLKDDIFSLGDIAAYKGIMSFPEKTVRSSLASIRFPLDRYIIHNGFIEDVINTDKGLPEKVSFAYVDFDFYEPIKIALDFLRDVTNTNSVIIVDDYDYFSTGAKDAVDEFLKKVNEIDLVFQIEVPDNRYGHFAILKMVP